MITIKTPGELEIMAEGGKILTRVFKEILKIPKVGATPKNIEEETVRLIKSENAQASFKMVEGYKWATCIAVNDVVVHGIPNKTPFNDGDIVGIDLGVFYKGFHTDASWTVIVGKADEKSTKFLEAGKKALSRAVSEVKIGNAVGDISKAIEEEVRKGGFSPVKALVGHGVGRELHEDPQIPGFLRGKIENTPKLKEGMVLAIEVIYNMGVSPVVYKNDDGWTISTSDGLPSGLFEETVAVTRTGPWVLTDLA